MHDGENQGEQREALGHINAARSVARQVAEKLESGDLRGALARVGFLMRHLGDCVEELNAAMGKANDMGYLPPLPRSAEE